MFYLINETPEADARIIETFDVNDLMLELEDYFPGKSFWIDGNGRILDSEGLVSIGRELADLWDFQKAINHLGTAIDTDLGWMLYPDNHVRRQNFLYNNWVDVRWEDGEIDNADEPLSIYDDGYSKNVALDANLIGEVLEWFETGVNDYLERRADDVVNSWCGEGERPERPDFPELYFSEVMKGEGHYADLKPHVEAVKKALDEILNPTEEEEISPAVDSFGRDLEEVLY